MSVSGWEQLLFVVAVTAVAAPLLGRYLAATFRGAGATGTTAPGDRLFLPVERLIYRALGVDPDSSWTWRAYALAVLALGLAGTLLLYAILRLQGVLPGNPSHAPGMSPLLSFNTAISFITGTNWQAYEGENAGQLPRGHGRAGGRAVPAYTRGPGPPSTPAGRRSPRSCSA
jgi:potassium-transporting ATPase potassium-binding subunit